LKDEANRLLTEVKFALTNQYNEKEFFEPLNLELELQSLQNDFEWQLEHRNPDKKLSPRRSIGREAEGEYLRNREERGGRA
jgi:hypothetical protein